MACRDEPPRYYNILTALTTLSLTGGKVLAAFGFFGFAAAADLTAFFGGEAGFSATGNATTGAVSVYL